MLKYDLEPTNENLKFTIEKNILNNNNKLIILSKLLSNVNDNLVISIDGKWGSGKTFFVKQFKYLIDNIDDYEDDRILSQSDKVNFKKLHESSLVVYYNAWENDMHTNILESLIYNILNEYPKMKNQIVDFNNFKGLLKSFCRDVISSLSNEIFDINNIDSINSFNDLADEIITIEEKKDAFNKLINEIVGDKQRLILIIDELDRCRPTFTVEMLETIKHFYTNSKMTIIFSINNLELSNTIKNIYGSDFDGYGYLNKFYDFIINLETKDVKPYLQKQFKFCTTSWVYHDMSYIIMDYFNFSLRECNRYITMYNMLKSYIEEDDAFNKEAYYIHTCILVPLALALKIKDGNSYNLFVSKKGTKIISDFLDNEITNTKFEGWIRELIKMENEEDYKKKILDVYYDVFSTNYNYHRYPFFEVISMLGTNILIDKESDDNE